MYAKNFTYTKKINVYETAAVNLSKVYFLKNAKKICKTNNHDLNRGWKIYYHVKTAASRTFAFSRKYNVYIIWINVATINQDSSSSVWGSIVKSYPLIAFINDSLPTTYYNQVSIEKQWGPGNETDLHQNKKNPDRPNLLANPGRVTLNKQFFKSSLISLLCLR